MLFPTSYETDPLHFVTETRERLKCTVHDVLRPLYSLLSQPRTFLSTWNALLPSYPQIQTLTTT